MRFWRYGATKIAQQQDHISVPSVKGLLIISSVVGIRAALEDNEVSQDEVDVALEAEDLALLEAKLEPTRWYPVASLGRMTELLAKIAGGDRADALRAMGVKSAEAIRKQGTYSQMTYEEGTLEKASALELKSFSRLTATMHNVFFNFGESRVDADPETGAILIHYTRMESYPDATRLSSEGYASRMSTLAVGRECEARSENVRRDGFTLRIALVD